MNNLKDVIAYILKHYPRKEELSKARVTKMVYLSDWHQCINHSQQITEINWYFDNYGPFVNDVNDTIVQNPQLFTCKSTSNIFGGNKNLYGLNGACYQPTLAKKAKESIDHVVEQTKSLRWSNFINLVYSTYPVISSERYSKLDLISKAREYKRMR